MFNLGLYHQLPGSSAHCVIRRFYNSNPTIKPRDLKPWLGLSKRAATLDVNFNLVNRIQPEMTKLPGAPRIYGMFHGGIRNCSICASIGYHCFLFDCLWMDRCPVHAVPLTEVCPKCGRRWRDVHRYLGIIRCDVCGRISFDLLAKRGAFTCRSKFEPIDNLIMALESPLFLHPIHGKSEFQFVVEYTNPQSSSYPSLLLHRSPKIQVKRFSDSVFRVKDIDCKIDGLSEEPNFEEKLELSLRIAKFRTLLRIYREFTRQFHHHPTLLPDSANSFRASKCLACIAYSAWVRRVSDINNIAKGMYLFGADILGTDQPFCDSIHHFHVKKGFVMGSPIQDTPFKYPTPSVGAAELVYSSELSGVLYFFTLWFSFLEILKNVYREFGKELFAPVQRTMLYEAYPFAGRPPKMGLFSGIPLVIKLASPSVARIFMPYNALSPRFKIRPHTETPEHAEFPEFLMRPQYGMTDLQMREFMFGYSTNVKLYDFEPFEIPASGERELNRLKIRRTFLVQSEEHLIRLQNEMSNEFGLAGRFSETPCQTM